MSNIPIADPDALQICPYDPAHRVQSRRMVYHLERCRKVFVGRMEICPFNGKHRVPAPELNYHMHTCPDKAMIDQDLRYSEMKRSGFMSDAPRGDLNTPPQDNFNVASEESWEDECNDNPSYFRLGRRRIDSSTRPCTDSHQTEPLRRPSFTATATANAPVYRYCQMNLARGRGRGIVPQENGMSKPGMSTSSQPPYNAAPVGRGLGLSKAASFQQRQKLESTTFTPSTENTFPHCGIGRGIIKKKENIEHNSSTENTFPHCGIGRGILKKKENIEHNPSNKTPKVATLEDLQRQSRRLEKKLRQISRLKEMQEHGTALGEEEELKLAQQETLDEELEQITSKIESWQLK